MIVFASSHFSDSTLANLRFEVADARQLPYWNEFDLVVSFNALHWVVDQDTALRSIRGALKPGGRALLRLVPSGQRKCLEDVIEYIRNRPCWSDNFIGFRRPYVHFTPEDYRALAEQAGFQVNDLRVEDKAWDFKTREMFVAFARATFVEWTQHLPKSEWESFITEVLDSYQSVVADSPEEANTFKFYQMEVEITPKS
jgi:SAM-dependent methyltransferase